MISLGMSVRVHKKYHLTVRNPFSTSFYLWSLKTKAFVSDTIRKKQNHKAILPTLNKQTFFIIAL